MYDVLQRDGLTVQLLEKLSYKSTLGISLKKNLHYFKREEVFSELISITEWYDRFEELHSLALDYRIKSLQSAVLKYERYYPDHQLRKVFDDLLGFRSLVDSYDEVLILGKSPKFRLADLSDGKANDDGYRGVHLYFQLDGSHYPIEIQYNTYRDRQFNNWLHKYCYKRGYNDSVGCMLRQFYDTARIHNEQDFKEVLKSVLFDSKRC